MSYPLWATASDILAVTFWLAMLARPHRWLCGHCAVTRRNAKIDAHAKDKAGLQVTRTSKQASCQHPRPKRWDVHTLDGTLCGYLCAQCGAGITLASFLRPPEPIQAYPDPPAQQPAAEPAPRLFPIPPAEELERAIKLAFSIPPAQMAIPLEFIRPVLPPIDTN